ncbi:envelope glycoprotein [Arabidopsis thaliana]|uniref:Envelope glycoprotein n=1 Tax=Arabidopsis thaliana TaxID=3702 RepID=Q8VZ11_ARATH|nr:envelope glycoprotein [Arabidopsis thaliana]AAL38834.1 unknown protein [Arabidopsis thaliana]AAM20358.1 unknown protein [Arabidopsis thaliana]AEC09112.1 envelope glycoprotein [Arabidopsis thaliana]|eukprot:NP_850246.1 envelope glycoprotein [Arabidopsis thaliana]
MVLWELALGTAYFLGIRRTYRLALKTQRRLVSPKHPRIRDFMHRRTYQIFDMALRVHKNIQQRDMVIGRNLGNWILRGLDRMKPSAQVLLPKNTEPSIDKAKRVLQSTRLKPHVNTQTPQNREVDRNLFMSLRNFRSKYPIASMMMIKPPRSTGTTTQYRPYSVGESSLIKPIYARGGFNSVIRKDILQWMVQKR